MKCLLGMYKIYNFTYSRQTDVESLLENLRFLDFFCDENLRNRKKSFIGKYTFNKLF